MLRDLILITFEEVEVKPCEICRKGFFSVSSLKCFVRSSVVHKILRTLTAKAGPVQILLQSS